ncbi:5800_t:CDS:2 [Dentiscutata erythropus]|uniref:5800_t:CDS:1 n=1 Tax=Dentiscutata erythropus TaxID=1348616 RepID=A0A9N9AQH9_9GLOM|nr:5800_t:CDS:2 [Dentiscutata erythropus]
MASQIRSLFDNPKSADIMLRVDGKIYHGHTCIMIATSAYLAHKFRVPELSDHCENLLTQMWDRRMWRITLKVSKWLRLNNLRQEILKFLWSKGVDKLFNSRISKFIEEGDIKEIIKLAENEKERILTSVKEEQQQQQETPDDENMQDYYQQRNERKKTIMKTTMKNRELNNREENQKGNQEGVVVNKRRMDKDNIVSDYDENEKLLQIKKRNNFIPEIPNCRPPGGLKRNLSELSDSCYGAQSKKRDFPNKKFPNLIKSIKGFSNKKDKIYCQNPECSKIISGGGTTVLNFCSNNCQLSVDNDFFDRRQQIDSYSGTNNDRFNSNGLNGLNNSNRRLFSSTSSSSRQSTIFNNHINEDDENDSSKVTCPNCTYYIRDGRTACEICGTSVRKGIFDKKKKKINKFMEDDDLYFKPKIIDSNNSDNKSNSNSNKSSNKSFGNNRLTKSSKSKTKSTSNLNNSKIQIFGDQIQCPICFYLNHNLMNKCEICYSELNPVDDNDFSWIADIEESFKVECPTCSYSNNPNAAQCEMCYSPIDEKEFKDLTESVQCPTCTFINNSSLITCEICNVELPGGAELKRIYIELYTNTTRMMILNKDDPDYIAISQRFLVGLPRARINAILRLQMPKKLVDAHEQYKQQTGFPTHQMFHGTNVRCNPERYYGQPGWEYCKDNCGLCGISQYGMWFARHSSVSLGYCGNVAIKAMFSVDIVSQTAQNIIIVDKEAVIILLLLHLVSMDNSINDKRIKETCKEERKYRKKK